jgi:hypothetical protein
MNREEEVTLYRRIPEEGGGAFVQKIWSGPLPTALTIACQGHEGLLEHMLIRTCDGREYTLRLLSANAHIKESH